MTKHNISPHDPTQSETPYDPTTDPDWDPEMYSSHRRPQQPNQAEGADLPEEDDPDLKRY